MKYAYLILVLGLITTGCDKGFKFASTIPAPEKPVCSQSPEDLSVPSLVQRGQSFSMSFNYLNVRWALTNLGTALRFEGSPVELSLNSLGTFVGRAEGTNNCGEDVFADFEILVIEPVDGLSVVINNNNTYTRTQNVSLSLSANGATEMYVTNVANCSSGGTWETYGQQKTWLLGDNNKLTRVYAKYRNRLIETPCISDDITHDDIVPVVRFVSIPTVTTSRNVTVEMDAEDNLSGVKAKYCRIDSEAFRACQNSETFSNLTDGTHVVNLYAEDNAGNISQVDSRSFTVDTTLPSVRITSAPLDPSNSSSASFNFDGTDSGQPIQRFECSLDNSVFSSCSPIRTYNNLSNGPHIFRVRGLDTVGNRSAEASHSWTIDTSAPVVTITAAPSSPTPDTNANFEFTVSEVGTGLASVTCSLNNGVAVACTSPHSLAGLSNGIHSFRVTARDNAGNTGSAVHTWEINDRIQIQPIVVQPGLGKTDILFMMDSTGSMYDIYRNDTNFQFRNFLSTLNGTDYQIGVVTSDYRDGGPYREGKIVPIEEMNNQYVISPNNPNTLDSFLPTISRREVTCVYGTWTGPNGNFCGTSGWNLPVSTQIIRAGIRTFSHPNNQFFFRPDAALNVVVVSDSDEVCASGMTGSDGACLPQDTLHSPEAMINAVRSQFPEKQFKFHSLVHKQGDTGCDMGPSNVGHSYIKLAQMTGGVSRSVCRPSQTEGTAIANAIKSGIDPVYNLRCVPTDTNADGTPDVSVTYNPQPNQQITHTVVGSTIRFNPQPPAGTNITLRYACP